MRAHLFTYGTLILFLFSGIIHNQEAIFYEKNSRNVLSLEPGKLSGPYQKMIN